LARSWARFRRELPRIHRAAAIPNTKATIRDVSTGVVTQVTSNETGIYNAANLLPGDYQVNVVAGLSPQQRSGIVFAAGERQILKIRLRVGARRPRLDATGDPRAGHQPDPHTARTASIIVETAASVRN